MAEFHSYMVIYDFNSGSVLVAFKKIVGFRFKGRTYNNGSYLNYGGQLVFPGGKEVADTAELAAFEEFRQETGVNARDYIDDDTVWTMSFEGGFHATFAEVHDGYAEALVRDININILQGATEDEELAQVGFVSYGLALRELPVWKDSSTTPEALDVLAGRSKYSFDKSWFFSIMRALIKHLNEMQG